MSTRTANGTEECDACHLPMERGEEYVEVNDETVHLGCEGAALASLIAEEKA